MRPPQTSRGVARAKKLTLYATLTPPHATNALKLSLQSGVTLTRDGKGVVFERQGGAKEMTSLFCTLAGRGRSSLNPSRTRLPCTANETRVLPRQRFRSRLPRGRPWSRPARSLHRHRARLRRP